MNWQIKQKQKQKNKNKKTKRKSQFNDDLYLSSINIASETTLHSLSNDISYVKWHHLMNHICGK